jgi:hypothetical protein
MSVESSLKGRPKKSWVLRKKLLAYEPEGRNRFGWFDTEKWKLRSYPVVNSLTSMCVQRKKLPQQYCRANASLFPIHLKTVRPCVKLYGLWSKTHKKYKWTVWSTDHKRQLGYLPLNFHVNLVEVKLEKICHAMLWTDVGYNEGSLRCLLLERSWVCNLSDRCREALLYCSGPELAS